MPQKKSSQARLDEMARAQGFPNYAAMRAWNEKYRSKKTGTGAPPQRNFLQSLAEKVPFHPSRLFKYVNDRVGPAMERKK